jgi:hypothetical protein
MNWLTLPARTMVYLVGGYKLTYAQTREWCHSNGLYPPEFNESVYVNRWLRSNDVKTRLLGCDYLGEPIFLVVTHRRVDSMGTRTQFEPFQEDGRAISIKEKMKELKVDIDNIEFVTVPNPYGDY